jgi:hypothetical protein
MSSPAVKHDKYIVCPASRPPITIIKVIERHSQGVWTGTLLGNISI